MLRNILIGVVVLFVLIQLVPYGRNHDNPPVVQEPTWDSALTRDLAVRACYDCHSNETEWLWYHNIAPISWGVQFDVDQGRATMNFSEWNREQDEAKDAAEVIAEGEMPPDRYTIVHPSAVLNDAEKEQLMQGLARTIGAELDGDEDRNNNSGDDDNSGSGNGDDRDDDRDHDDGDDQE
jgi:hypothetical protein